MTITEIRDELTRLIDAGHGENRLIDGDNTKFAITEISTKLVTCGTLIYFEMDEV